MHSIGNDYVFIDCFDTEVKEPEKIAKFVSRRRTNIGSDGLILIMPSETQDCKMRIFNADGSEGIMCGNGVRCVGSYIYKRRGIRKTPLLIETKAGVCEVMVEEDMVTATMGKPEFTMSSVGMNKGFLYGDGGCCCKKTCADCGDKEHLIDKIIIVNKKRFIVSCVSMGNPHCVIFLNELPADIEGVSKLLSVSRVFENGINIEYAYVINSNTIGARVYERGSGETWGCGSGACAIACAAVKTGRFLKDRWNNIIFPGGQLQVMVKEDWSVLLRGKVEFAFDGFFDM